MKVTNKAIILTLFGFVYLNSDSAYSEMYLGAKTGKTWMDFNSCQKSVSCKDNSSSFGLILGNEFNNYLSLEGGYDHLGYFSFNDDEIKAITLAAKLSQKITDKSKFYTKLGGAFVDFGSINDDTSYLGSVGFEYNANSNWHLRLEYQKLFDISSNQMTTGSNTITLGFSYIINKPKYSKKNLTNQQPNIEKKIIKEMETEMNIFESNLSETLFDTNSTELKPESLYILNNVILIAKKHPQAKIIVTGHTDSTGS